MATTFRTKFAGWGAVGSLGSQATPGRWRVAGKDDMGFLDKVKSQAEQVAKQGQEKLGEVQAKRSADALLKDLGAWTYAVHTGRDHGHGAAQVDRLIAELQAHEAEHGPIEVGAPPLQPAAAEQAAATEPVASDEPANTATTTEETGE